MVTQNIKTFSGVAMPRLIYGTAWKKDRTADLVTKAVKFGFRGIDTACQPKHYNEAGVGEALHRLVNEGISRDSLYIQTKFTPSDGQDPFNIPYDRKAPLAEQVAQSFEVSKKNLGVNYVDALILHSPLENFDNFMVVWEAMEHVYKQGGSKQLGISNCYDLKVLKQLYETASVKPAVLQNRFYQDSGYDKDMRKWCQERKIIYQSFWTLTANPHILASDTLLLAAQTFQKTPAQIFFRFLTHVGIVPLTGTCSDKHMKEDLEIFNFELPEMIIHEIQALINI